MRGIERWSRRDPIWWRRGVIDIATMRIGDHQRCVLAQGYALRAEPSPRDPSGEPCLRAINNVYSNRIVGHSMNAGLGGVCAFQGTELPRPKQARRCTLGWLGHISGMSSLSACDCD
jgi:hypothetical protein